jgi:hypothetical protein
MACVESKKSHIIIICAALKEPFSIEFNASIPDEKGIYIEVCRSKEKLRNLVSYIMGQRSVEKGFDQKNWARRFSEYLDRSMDRGPKVYEASSQIRGCEYRTCVSHPDLRANPNARIHVRQDQVTHMHRLSEYQNTM